MEKQASSARSSIEQNEGADHDKPRSGAETEETQCLEKARPTPSFGQLLRILFGPTGKIGMMLDRHKSRHGVPPNGDDQMLC